MNSVFFSSFLIELALISYESNISKVRLIYN